MSQPRKRPRQQRATATWAAILDAAAQLFQTHGYTATTTNRVAERAGVSIGSLYQYFPNKDALLLALAERHIGQAVGLLAEVFAELEQHRPNLENTLNRLIDTAVTLHEADPAMHRLLFDQTPRSPETAVALRRLETLMASAVAAQLRRLGVGGRHSETRALLLVQGLEAQVHGAVLTPSATERSEVVAEMKAMWLAALGT